ncbi:signal transduction histidine kinase, partial [Candidatus Magnetoovum chiemensis]
RGAVNIDINKADDIICITIRDNGVGIPANIDLDSIDTFGISIVTSIVERQLRGRINLVRTNGAQFNIQIPVKRG